jgi:hypothetical protein
LIERALGRTLKSSLPRMKPSRSAPHIQMILRLRSTAHVLVGIGLVLLVQFGCGHGTGNGGVEGDDTATGATGDTSTGAVDPGPGSSGSSSGGAANSNGGSAQNTGGSKPVGSAGSSSGGATPGGGGTTPGSGGVGGPSKPIWPDGRGPSVAFTSYEAEDMTTNGVKTAPSRAFGSISTEASGRQAVTLAATGKQLEFTSKDASNSIVVRYSIPDNGHDYWTTLSVFVNDEARGKLNLTSRYSWTYGGDDVFNKPAQEDKGSGNPHHFYDEAHAIIGDVPAGAKLTLRKEADDTAAGYTIDLVELELVGGALAKSANALSIADCGAIPNDDKDDSAAIQKCIDQAQALHKELYIPEGAFQSYTKTLSANGLTIRGAGMWRSSIVGFNAQFDCWGAGGCKYYDFALFGDTVLRDDASPETGFRGILSGGVIQNIWMEHLKVGVWPNKGTANLLISGVRIRDLTADGVNFYNGTHDSVVENSHFRNTGDDSMAAWSDSTDSPGPDAKDTFRKNYVQVPWKANCFGIYGGQDIAIEDNVCADTVQYPGILFARQFNSQPFTGTSTVSRNTLIRAGGNAYNHTHGALKFHADQGPVGNIKVDTLDIIDPTNSGVHVQGLDVIDKVWLNGVTIQNAGNASFYLNGGSRGALDAVGVVVTGGATGVINESMGQFNLIKGAGSTGW